MYLFKKNIFDCRMATLLSIKKSEGKITIFGRIRLSYHLLYCDPCRRFIKQWQQLDLKRQEIQPPPVTLSDEAKARIQHVLNRDNQ